MRIFRSLADALSAGYTVFDHTDDGYLVRIRLNNGYALARVVLSQKGN